MSTDPGYANILEDHIFVHRKVDTEESVTLLPEHRRHLR
jgi:hypothetical protein